MLVFFSQRFVFFTALPTVVSSSGCDKLLVYRPHSTRQLTLTVSSNLSLFCRPTETTAFETVNNHTDFLCFEHR